jgi:transposase
LDFLSPHRPDLNPIEQVFAKIKLLLRKAETHRQAAPELQTAGSANYLRNAGYASV